MSVTPGASRLGFVEAARAAFDVLLDAPYRFVLVAEDGMRVRYQKDAVVLVLFHDRQSCELDVQVGRVGVAEEAERPYTLQDLMRVTDPETVRSYKRFAATTPDAVRRGAKRRADEAWAVKDCQRVVSAYASVSALSTAESQRLRIARGHLGGRA